MIDVNDFNEKWRQHWPEEFSNAWQSLKTNKSWVRFHMLPSSKRYPDTKEELDTTLSRHHTILEELYPDDRIYVVVSNWTPSATPYPNPWGGK